MKKRSWLISLLLALCSLLIAAFCAGCGSSTPSYTAEDIKYSSKAGECVAWANGIGDYWKTNNGGAMFGLKVKTDDSTLSVVAVGKTESSVTYHYDYNGKVYEYCKGSVEYQGETYYYNCGPFWYTRDVWNPMTTKSVYWIYSAYFDETEAMVRHMLEIADLSKLDVPTLSTPSDLFKLGNNNGQYMLSNDIDMEGALWEPLKGFKGTLDGNGYAIKNFTVQGKDGNFGFFDELNGAHIFNLTLENVSVAATGKTGDIGALSGIVKNGTVKNVTVKGSVTAEQMDNVGGIVGYTENTVVTNCKNYASVTGFEQVGGVVGQYAHEAKDEKGVLENNENYGEVTGISTDKECRTGGVFGRVNFWPGRYKDGPSNWLRTIKNCNNFGKVSGAGYNVGGVVGEYTTSRWKSGDTYVDVSFDSCTNEGQVLGSSFHVGGIVGACGTCRTVENCINKGAILSTGYDVGGIIGSGTAKSVTACKNEGPVSGAAFVGGIIGYTGGVITACENNGSVHSTGQRDTCDFLGENGVAGVGGIAGVTSRYVEKSVNNGNVQGSGGGSCIGGIAGGMVAKNGDVIEGNVNNGEVSAIGECYNVGGIAGKVGATRPGTGEGEYTFSSKNTGRVMAGASYRVGGIIGYVSAQGDYSYSDRTYLVAMNCENSGEVRGYRYVAGIVGLVYKHARKDDSYWSTNFNTGVIFAQEGEQNDLYVFTDTL